MSFSVIKNQSRTGEFSIDRGIKQGCPLSPKLFVYLVHQVLFCLQELMPELFLAHSHYLRLPCLRAYADDILDILTDEGQIEQIVAAFKVGLREFGL